MKPVTRALIASIPLAPLPPKPVVAPAGRAGAAAPTAVESAFSLIDYTGMLMMSL